MPPFVLVDGSYFLFRAYHAIPLLTTSKGLHTNAVRGASAAIQKLIRRVQPTHIVVLFDTPEPTFRHQLSTDYKGNRPSMPEELSQQIPYLHALIQAMGIPILALAGAEADDLIGTLTKRGVDMGHEVLISTGDKDMAQLVCPQVKLEDSFKERVLDEQGVFEKFGVRPDQIVDYLTLMGDSADGIKGVPGIGAKTAAKLLAEYDNIGNLIAHADQLKGKLGEKFRDNVDLIPLNHQLATIVCDLPLDLSWEQFKLQPANVDKLTELYTELEFRTQLQSLNHPNHPDQVAQENNIVATAPKQTQPTVTAKYHTILHESDWQALLAQLKRAKQFVIDTETTSLDYRQAEIVGLAIALDREDAYYVPLTHDYEDAPTQLNREQVLADLQPILQDPEIGKIGHHLKYDAHVLANHGIMLKGWAFDTMLASYVLNPTATRHNMDDVARLYLGHLTTTFEQVAGKGVKQKTFNQISIDVASDYAAEDAYVTFSLYQVLSEKLDADPILSKLFQEIELPVSQALCAMESRGVLLNPGFLEHLSQEFDLRIAALEQKAYEYAGKTFNVASPKQLGEVLFDDLAIKGGKKTASGQYSTSESVLEKIDHPLVETVLEYRGLAKLKNTYTLRLIEQADSNSHRVHTSYHQAVTSTGRLSSSDPNLQNIPIRDEVGRQIRQAFIAKQGSILLAADYSQIELRLMAHFSQDQALIDAFNQGQDIHQATAAEVLGIDLDAVTSDQRRQAKAVNFGLLYGMSEFGLARQLGFSRQQAQSYIKQYFSRYPGVYDYMQNTRQLALEQGFVETIAGRKLYTPDIDARNKMVRNAAERAAINAPLQGSAADIIKIAMLATEDLLASYSSQLLLQVHDELVIEAEQTEVETLIPKLKQAMEQVVQLDVPLIVEVGQGHNWDEAH